MIDILAFGGGVGSWGYAALVIQERIRAPWLAAIVNTGRECPSTWTYLTTHRKSLPFELHIIRQPLPSLYSQNGNTFLPGGYDTTTNTFLKGFCSSYWKRDRMRSWLIKRKKITHYNLAFGMHADEWQRMTKNRLKSVNNIYPIVDLGLTRADCAAAALEVFGELPPRSRCWMCPGQDTHDWKDIADMWPNLYAQAQTISAEAQTHSNFTLFGENENHPCGGECFV